MTPFRIRFVTASLCALLSVHSIAAAQNFEAPPNDGFYTETIDILTDDQEERLEGSLGTYARESGHSIAFLVMQSLTGSTLQDAAVQAAARWRLETGSGGDVLVAATLADHEEVMLVGSGASVALSDEVAAGIIATDIQPHFMRGEYIEGITAAVDAIQKHISGEYTVHRYDEPLGGGFGRWALAALFIALQYLMTRVLWRRKMWVGAIAGGIFGLYLAISYSWWLAVPLLIITGSVFDGIMMAAASSHGRRLPGSGTIIER
jgi:uncharacterized membrane protein YgcG